MGFTATLVNKEDYEALIRKCWASDQELLDKFHVKRMSGLTECVEDTLEALDKNVEPDFKLYEVKFNNAFFGFFGTEQGRTFGNFLTTFFVMPHLRVDHLKDLFFEFIKDNYFTEGPIFSSLYIHNTRAIKWLLNLGFYPYLEGKSNENKLLILKHD